MAGLPPASLYGAAGGVGLGALGLPGALCCPQSVVRAFERGKAMARVQILFKLFRAPGFAESGKMYVAVHSGS